MVGLNEHRGLSWPKPFYDHSYPTWINLEGNICFTCYPWGKADEDVQMLSKQTKVIWLHLFPEMHKDCGHHISQRAMLSELCNVINSTHLTLLLTCTLFSFLLAIPLCCSCQLTFRKESASTWKNTGAAFLSPCATLLTLIPFPLASLPKCWKNQTPTACPHTCQAHLRGISIFRTPLEKSDKDPSTSPTSTAVTRPFTAPRRGGGRGGQVWTHKWKTWGSCGPKTPRTALSKKMVSIPASPTKPSRSTLPLCQPPAPTPASASRPRRRRTPKPTLWQPPSKRSTWATEMNCLRGSHPRVTSIRGAPGLPSPNPRSTWSSLTTTRTHPLLPGLCLHMQTNLFISQP